MTATTSLARQVRRLQQARLRWKQRVAAKQREIRKLRVAVRDLSASRDLWKQRYRGLQRQQATPPGPVLLSAPEFLDMERKEADGVPAPVPGVLSAPVAPQEPPLGGR